MEPNDQALRPGRRLGLDLQAVHEVPVLGLDHVGDRIPELRDAVVPRARVDEPVQDPGLAVQMGQEAPRRTGARSGGVAGPPTMVSRPGGVWFAAGAGLVRLNRKGLGPGRTWAAKPTAPYRRGGGFGSSPNLGGPI